MISLHLPKLLLIPVTLYGQSITYPYLRVARQAGASHLELKPIHDSLLTHLRKVITQPKLLCGPDASYDTGSLDGKGWERPEAVYAVLALAPTLPDLEGVLVYLFEGALETWERFSTDVLKRQIPQGIDPNKIYAPPTNDSNESMMAGLRQEKIHAPNATLDYTNAKQQLKRNNTQTYIKEKMDDDQSWRFLRKRQREEEAKGRQRKQRKMVVRASRKRVDVQREKKTKKKQKEAAKDARLRACVPLTNVPRLEEVLVALRQNPPGPKAKEIKVAELDLQLDWHCNRQRRSGIDKAELIAPTSKLGGKEAKLELLVNMVKAWNADRGSNSAYLTDSEDVEDEEQIEDDDLEEADEIGYQRD
ncbi:hypothetical protein F5878DRAFT_658396 [Lentinula raphanica]|uniref:Uncharacterized protein n=1 Tax=Lentinula raphanica TaxID=153919 RepID=A0AA38PES0_9AGAR|nr:hypothetical protein F5878DRAFT_658396 [Lentinula raphanica]